MIYIKKEKTNVLVIYHKIVKNTKKKGKTIDKRKETDTVPEKWFSGSCDSLLLHFHISAC